MQTTGNTCGPVAAEPVEKPTPAEPVWFSQAALDVLAERRRQVEAEHWTPEHDDQHTDGSLALAAAAYAIGAVEPKAQIDIRAGRANQFWTAGWLSLVHLVWPRSWSTDWLKPTTPRRDLVKAAAMLLAEIERQDRAS